MENPDKTELNLIFFSFLLYGALLLDGSHITMSSSCTVPDHSNSGNFASFFIRSMGITGVISLARVVLFFPMLRTYV
jgi:hypothetical protein